MPPCSSRIIAASSIAATWTANIPTTPTATPACRRVPSPILASPPSAPPSPPPTAIRSTSWRAPMAPAATSFPPTSPPTKSRWSAIAVPSTNRSIKQQLRDYLAAIQPTAITEAVWHHLLQNLAPVSESYLRDLLRATDQPFAGIRQHTFEELEQSLVDVLEVYRAALSAGHRDRARYCRRQVIAAKDRAKWTAITPRTNPEKRTQKEEMAQWMLVWLENPEVFPAWVDARKKSVGQASSPVHPNP